MTGTNILQQKNYNYLTYTKKDYICPFLAGSLCYCLLHHTHRHTQTHTHTHARARLRAQSRIGVKIFFLFLLIILRQNFQMSVSVLSEVF